MINRRNRARAWKMSLLAVFLVLGLSSASQAGPLGVNIDPVPDIMAQFIVSSYNATTGAFSATGWAMTLDTGTGAQNITTNFKVQATVDKTGVASSGTLTVGNAASPVLYSVNLLGFAYNAVQGGALEFLFGDATGSYVPSIYSALKPIDVMISAGNGFIGSFANSWTSTSGTAEVKSDPPPSPNPEPSALLLMLLGGGLVAGFYSQRGRRLATLGQ